MKPEKIAAVFLVSVAVISLILTFAVNAEEEKWRSEVIYEGETDFVQLEIKDGVPNVAFSTDEGIVLKRKNTSSAPLPAFIKRHLAGPGWEKEFPSSEKEAGFYLSMSQNDEGIAMTYQYKGLTERKLGYTHRVNGTWVTEEVDSVHKSGWGPGKYTSLSFSGGEPVIFYHTAEGDKFIKGERNNGSWERQVLETDTGMFISSESCERQTHVLYSSREKQSLYRGVMEDNNWSSERIENMTDADTAVDLDGCRAHTAYHSPETDSIVYRKGNSTENVGSGKLSRLSLDYREKPRISYYDYGKGLYYSTRDTDGGWKSTLLDGERDYAGEYNDIETFSDGSPAVAYSTDSQVIYTEFGTGLKGEIETFFRVLFLVTVVPAVLMLLYLEKETHRGMKLFKRFRKNMK